MGGCLAQHVETFLVGSVRIDELEVFANRTGEELCVLRHQTDSLAQPVEIYLGARDAVVEDLAILWQIQSHQQLHQRRFARARGTDERDRLAPLHIEGDVGESRGARTLVHEADVLELESLDVRQWHRSTRLGVLWRLQNLSEVLERDLRLAIDVDDVAQLLHRSEDEERVEEE